MPKYTLPLYCGVSVKIQGPTFPAQYFTHGGLGYLDWFYGIGY